MKSKAIFKRYAKIFKFISSSFISFVIDYLSFLLFETTIGVSLIRSNLYARLISGTVNFLLNKKYVFRNGEEPFLRILQYIFLATVIIIINSILLRYLSVQLSIFAPIAKIIVEVIMFTLSYLIQKYIIFKE